MRKILKNFERRIGYLRYKKGKCRIFDGNSIDRYFSKKIGYQRNRLMQKRSLFFHTSYGHQFLGDSGLRGSTLLLKFMGWLSSYRTNHLKNCLLLIHFIQKIERLKFSQNFFRINVQNIFLILKKHHFMISESVLNFLEIFHNTSVKTSNISYTFTNFFQYFLETFLPYRQNLFKNKY